MDIDDIAMELGYKLPMGCWIEVEGYGEPFNIGNDQQLMWFVDKIPYSRVLNMYLEPIVPLQEVKGNELIPSQQPESQYHSYELSDDEENHVDVGFNGEYGAAGVDHGPNKDNKDGDNHATGVDSGEAKELVESDYEQELDDLAADTCVDFTKYWDTLQVTNIPCEEYAYGSNIDDGSDELRSLEGSDGEEVEGGPLRKFINRSYHEFNPRRDM
ncbi:hypothetical protein LWI29_022767 [Acer saccharum]|uniref:Uncharacterized protein n=1 Tax=Acer saccharum TaxID=4024 RepID=A0AA39VXX4_ACESA|nr:hypothetical protein LWI29_022767 [Acer saccharum]